MSGRNDSDKVKVRVLDGRALSLPTENGGSVLYRAGVELELVADEAKQLASQGFVESV